MPDHGPHDPAATATAAARVSLLRIAASIGPAVLMAAAAWLSMDRRLLAEWREDAGPIPFFLALAVLPAVGMPATPFFLLAGALFGVWLGLGVTAVGVAANLLLCHWLSRSALRPWLVRALNRTPYAIPDLSVSRRQAVRFTLLLRLAPVIPTFIKNYALGLAGVPLRVYFPISFAFTFVYAAAFIVLGESIPDRDFTTVGVVAVGLLAVGAMLYVFRKRRTARSTRRAPPPGQS